MAGHPFGDRETWQDRIEVLRDSWRLIVFICGSGLLVAYCAFAPTSPLQMAPVTESGEIVRFGSHATDLGEKPLVIVRFRDGTTRPVFIRRLMLRGCRKGDHIALIRRGGMVTVHARGCSRAKP